MVVGGSTLLDTAAVAAVAEGTHSIPLTLHSLAVVVHLSVTALALEEVPVQAAQRPQSVAMAAQLHLVRLLPLGVLVDCREVSGRPQLLPTAWADFHHPVLQFLGLITRPLFWDLLQPVPPQPHLRITCLC